MIITSAVSVFVTEDMTVHFDFVSQVVLLIIDSWVSAILALSKVRGQNAVSISLLILAQPRTYRCTISSNLSMETLPERTALYSLSPTSDQQSITSGDTKDSQNSADGNSMSMPAIADGAVEWVAPKSLWH